MKYLNRDIITGVLLLTFTTVLYFIVIPSQISAPEGGPIALSPRFFCDVITAILFFLSLLLSLNGIKKIVSGQHEPASNPLNTNIIRASVAVFFSATYIFIIQIVGYYIATALIMVFFLLFFGVKSWKSIVLFLLIILLFTYLLFEIALKVYLPPGSLFGG